MRKVKGPSRGCDDDVGGPFVGVKEYPGRTKKRGPSWKKMNFCKLIPKVENVTGRLFFQ